MPLPLLAAGRLQTDEAVWHHAKCSAVFLLSGCRSTSHAPTQCKTLALAMAKGEVMSDAVQQCLSLVGLSRMFVLHGAMITCTGDGFASATSNVKLSPQPFTKGRAHSQWCLLFDSLRERLSSILVAMPWKTQRPPAQA